MNDDQNESPNSEDVDATGATPEERKARNEVFEAIEHLKSTANILFGRAKNDPAIRRAAQDAERFVQTITDHAETGAQKIGAGEDCTLEVGAREVAAVELRIAEVCS